MGASHHIITNYFFSPLYHEHGIKAEKKLGFTPPLPCAPALLAASALRAAPALHAAPPCAPPCRRAAVWELPSSCPYRRAALRACLVCAPPYLPSSTSQPSSCPCAPSCLARLPGLRAALPSRRRAAPIVGEIICTPPRKLFARKLFARLSSSIVARLSSRGNYLRRHIVTLAYRHACLLSTVAPPYLPACPPLTALFLHYRALSALPAVEPYLLLHLPCALPLPALSALIRPIC